MVRDSPRQWAGNVSLLVIAAACKHQLDGCCSTLLGCGSGEYIIPIFWKGKLRMKKNQRKPLEASAIGTQEPFNVKCTFILTPCMVCLVLEPLLVMKSGLCLGAEGGVSQARAAASAKCGYVYQGAGLELCGLPGLDWVAQMRECLECLRFKILCIFRSAELWG